MGSLDLTKSQISSTSVNVVDVNVIKHTKFGGDQGFYGSHELSGIIFSTVMFC